MKLCPTCGQSVAEEMGICPSCGSEIGEGRRFIDDYRIVDVLHEGYSSFLYRAIHEPTHQHFMIRLFTSASGVNEEVAARLKREIERLKELPREGFVRPGNLNIPLRLFHFQPWKFISESVIRE
jgi:hypothetical protein